MLASLVAVAVAAAAVPQVVVTTGRLTDGQDHPLSGLQKLTFGLFGGSVKPITPDAPVWTETYKTLLDANGVYAVRLGDATDDSGAAGKKPFDATTWTTGPLFLEVAVNGETLTPRTTVGSAPWALAAADSFALGGQAPAYYATASDDAAKLPLAGGTLTGALTGTAATFAGAVQAQSFAGNGAGLTNVTGTDATKLPLSGGTLAGALSGTTAAFTGAVSGASFTGAHVGDGSMLTNVAGTDATKLALAGGTLSGALNGTAATFSGAVQAQSFSGGGAGLTGVSDATKLALAGGTLSGALNGTAATFSGAATLGSLAVTGDAVARGNLWATTPALASSDWRVGLKNNVGATVMAGGGSVSWFGSMVHVTGTTSTSQPDYSYYYLLLWVEPVGNANLSMPFISFSGTVGNARSNLLGVGGLVGIYGGRGYNATSSLSLNFLAGLNQFSLVHNVPSNGKSYAALMYDTHMGPGILSWWYDLYLMVGADDPTGYLDDSFKSLTSTTRLDH